jgi:metal-sulfur cluster biosynthetic enzyme
MGDVRRTIVDALRDVHDPCCAERGISVVDMGLIDEIHVDGDGDGATVDLVLTSGWCPFVVPLVDTIRSRIAELDLGRATDVQVVWDRAWTSERMSPEARRQLQFLPPPNETTGGGAAAITAPSPANPVQHATPEVQQ